MRTLSGPVLVAVDGSRESKRAAGMASRLSRELGSELHLVCVGAMLEGYTPWDWKVLDADSLIRVRELAEEEAKTILEEQVQRLREAGVEVVVETHVRTGRPEAEIVKLAEELDTWLLVLGSRGLGPLKRAALGSVSSRVVRHAHSSVLVVREDGTEERDELLLPGRVLLALDGSKDSAAATRVAVEISQSIGSELHILFVMHPYIPPVGPGVPEDWKGKLERARRHARAWVDQQAQRIESEEGKVKEAHLAFGQPEKEIVKLAEELEADLVVLGSRGLGGIRRALMGSVSDSVVRYAHCSVLVVREEEDRHQSPDARVGEERERSLGK